MAAEIPSATKFPLARRTRAALWWGIWRRWWVRSLVAILWIFFVLYPNPMKLVHSIQRVNNVPVDVPAAAGLAATLPDDPRLIENAVLLKFVPYELDWQVHGVPWYFPTTQEVLLDGRGDCESRATLLASILAAKHIPYRMKISMDHLWIDYPGKLPNEIENDSVTIGVGDGHGYAMRLPRLSDIWISLRSGFDWYWVAMPWTRKLLILGGLYVILFGALAPAWTRRALTPMRRRRVA